MVAFCVVALLVFGACDGEAETVTVATTKTITQPAATVTTTVTQPAATVTTTVTKTATGTTAPTTSPSVPTTAPTTAPTTSPTTSPSVTTPTTTFPGLFGRAVDETVIVSDDGKLQIIKHSMTYNEGIHDVQGMYVQFTMENLTNETVEFKVIAQLYDNNGVITEEGDIPYRKSIAAGATLDFQIQTFVMKAWFFTLQIETL